jgi:hypothetical protein
MTVTRFSGSLGACFDFELDMSGSGQAIPIVSASLIASPRRASIAVGLTLGGIAIPAFAIFFKAYELGRWTYGWRNGSASVDADSVVGIIATLGGMYFGFRYATILRRWADRELSQIED